MTADQLRKSMLQQAIQGKLVPQDPNDEPASALLERVREEKARLVKEKKIKKEKNPSVIFRGEDNSHYEKFILTGEVKCIDDEIPFELPKGWEWCRLGEVITLLSGRDLEPCRYNSECKGIPYMTGASNVKNGRLIVNRWTETPATISRYGELILTCKGTIGALAFNDIGDVHIARQMMSISSPLDLVYLREYIDSHVLRLDYRAKSIIPGISREDILSVLLALPPLAEQQRIVAKIEELRPLVEQYDKAQSELEALNSNIREQLKKSILQYAIEGKLVPQCEEDGTAEDLLQEIQAEKQRLYAEGKLKKKDLTHSTIFRGEDNKYYEKTILTGEVKCIDEEIPFELPNGWEWCRLGDVGDWGAGATPLRSNPKFFGGHIPWLKTGELNYDVIFETEECITKKALQECSLRLCSQGDVLIAMYGATIGKLGIAGIELTTNQACCACTPILFYNMFLFYYLMASKQVFVEQGEGGAQPNISRIKLVSHLFPMPPLAEQHRIVDKIKLLFDRLK